jgi:hypothetical protein
LAAAVTNLNINLAVVADRDPSVRTVRRRTNTLSIGLSPQMVPVLGRKDDGDDFRADIESRGARPVIPNKFNTVTLHRFSKRAHKGRNDGDGVRLFIGRCWRQPHQRPHLALQTAGLWTI